MSNEENEEELSQLPLCRVGTLSRAESEHVYICAYRQGLRGMGVFEPLLSPRVIKCLLCVSLVVDDYMCSLKRGPFHKLLRELDREVRNASSMS